MPQQLSDGGQASESRREPGRQRPRGEGSGEKEVTSHQWRSGKTPWHVPCYVSSVERLILPVGRIRFLICSEGFSCQSLNVLKPHKAMPSISSSVTFLTVGHREVRDKEGEARWNLLVTSSTFSETWKVNTSTRTLRTASNTRRHVERARATDEEDSCCGRSFKTWSKNCHH